MSGAGKGRGPRLPSNLARELGQDVGGSSSRGGLSGAHGRGGSVAGGSRKEQRKAERQAKWRPAPPAPSRPVAAVAAGRQRSQAAPERRPAKRQRSDSQRVPASAAGRPSKRPGSNKFEDLLGRGNHNVDSADPELALQRALAKKLGMKKGKASMGGDDGLDELLQELGGVEDLLDSGSDSELAGVGTGAQRNKKRSITVEAPLSGEDDDGMDESDLEEEKGDASESEGDFDLLGSESELEDAGTSDGEDGSGSDGARDVDSQDDSGLGGDASSGESEEAATSGEGGSSSDSEEGAGGEGQAATGVAPAPAGAGKYVPPALRKAAGGDNADEEAARVARRVRGLLNRLADANLQGIAGDLAKLYQSEGRRLVSDAVSSELVAAVVEGPRASERFAVVAAATVAGLAGSTGAGEVVANFLARVATALEAAMGSGDSLAAGNLVMVVAHLYLSGALKADLVYSLLQRWRQRFSEADVVGMAGVLGAAGLVLRAADPERMKDFVVAVHSRAAEVGKLSTRAQVMLDVVVDVKNNRKREDAARRHGPLLAPAAAKWLKSCSVGAVSVGGIPWEKVLAGDRRGIWWEPTAADAAAAAAAVAAAGASGLDGDAAAALGPRLDAGMAAPELLRLAAKMRMNTDTRRAVFCVIMGAEDCVDAFERLLRLNLKGEQEREVVRVTVECCLQEAAWNPYYAHLLTRLAGCSKGHRITLQYCLWDHIKEVGGMAVRRMANLARLGGAVVGGGALPLSVLKVADFAEALPAREVLFWRAFCEHLLGACKSDEQVTAMFGRLAAHRQLAELRRALGLFLKRSVGPWLAQRDPAKENGAGGAGRLDMLLKRCRLAERALASSGGH